MAATINELMNELIIAKQSLPDLPNNVELVLHHRDEGWTAEFVYSEVLGASGGIFTTNEPVPTAEDALNVVLWKVLRNKRGDNA